MNYKKFGNTDMNVSPISVGTWGIGGAMWGGANKDESIEAIKTMVDNGVNMIDTAPAYGMGEAERVIGEAIKEYDRSKLFIASKFGMTFPNPGGGPPVKNASKENILREIDITLANLGTDYLDLYLLHWPDVDTKAPASETFAALEELRQQGKIKYLGACNYDQALIEEAQKYCTFDALQLQYSMVQRDSEATLKWAADQGIATMAYAPLGAGILTGRFRELPEFGPGEARDFFYPFFKEPTFSKVMELLKVLDEIAAAKSVPVSQVTINWTVQKSFVSTALLGARTKAHGLENVAAVNWSLSDDEIAKIDDAIASTLG